MEFAAANQHPGPAAVAAEILGRRGSVDLLAGENGKPRTLTRAAAHPDRRLRFAAVTAIIMLDPQDPYPGSSLVADALKFLMGSHGLRTAVVGDLRSASTEEIAGLLAPLGYQVRSAISSRDLVRQAIAASDLELVLVDMNLAGELSAKVVQDLRHDCRTAEIPVGLLAAGSNAASIDEELDRADIQATQNALAKREAEIAKARADKYPPPENGLLGNPAEIERRLANLETSLAPMVELRVRAQGAELNRARILARRQLRTAAVLRPLNFAAMQSAVAQLQQLAPDRVPAEAAPGPKPAIAGLAGQKAASACAGNSIR